MATACGGQRVGCGQLRSPARLTLNFDILRFTPRGLARSRRPGRTSKSNSAKALPSLGPGIEAAPAEELAALYAQRWEIESALSVGTPMVLLADRSFYSFELWNEATPEGARELRSE